MVIKMTYINLEQIGAAFPGIPITHFSGIWETINKHEGRPRDDFGGKQFTTTDVKNSLINFLRKKSNIKKKATLIANSIDDVARVSANLGVPMYGKVLNDRYQEASLQNALFPDMGDELLPKEGYSGQIIYFSQGLISRLNKALSFPRGNRGSNVPKWEEVLLYRQLFSKQEPSNRSMVDVAHTMLMEMEERHSKLDLETQLFDYKGNPIQHD